MCTSPNVNEMKRTKQDVERNGGVLVRPLLPSFSSGSHRVSDEGIDAMQANIDKVEKEIDAVAGQLAGKEKELAGLAVDSPLRGEVHSDIVRLGKKEEQLRKEKEQLRKEKEQLRKEKEQLREEKLLLERQRALPSSSGSRDPFAS
jgi:septal ring factor EnvC (AmiA/AmiB activator)